MSDEDKLAPKPTVELEPAETESPEGDYYTDSDRFHRFFDYINTKKGDVMLGRAVSILEKLSPAAEKFLEALTEVKKANPGIEYKKWLALLIVRAFVVVCALVATIYLKYTGNLDSTTSLIIVTIATVFFTFGRKQE